MVIIIPITTIASSCSSTSIKLDCGRCWSTVRGTCSLMLMMITILMVVMVMVSEMVVMVSGAEEITCCGWYVVTLAIFFTWGEFWIYYNSRCRCVVLVMIR